MPYTKLFDPHAADTSGAAGMPERVGDRNQAGMDGGYEYDDDIVLAVNVALAVGRPLLVRGLPGTGKSSLARDVARRLGRRYYATTVSSRSTARDLLWTYDTAGRLADAQAGRVLPAQAYVTPSVLWWAFDPASAAASRGVPDLPGTSTGMIGHLMPLHAGPPTDPAESVDWEIDDPDRSVVLIDEIDKADPDVPNDLLLPLGSFQFPLDDGAPVTARRAPLVIITTNEERDLPKAFLRRCVVLALSEPDDTRLRSIARRHFPDLPDDPLTQIIAAYQEIRAERSARGDQPPSVAEFLDALAAFDGLGSGPDEAIWPSVVRLLLDKAPGPELTE